MSAVYSNIVVGTDGSETAGVAVAHAAALAQLSGATLHLVYAWDVSEAMAVAEGGAPDGVQEMLDLQAATCAAAGVRAEVHVVRHAPVKALETVVERTGAELLVVGNRGMSGAGRLLGSVPNKISHDAPCNLLIVQTS